MTMLSKQEYYDSLPKKPMGSDVMLFNDKNDLLLVKPNYKDEWLMPGGTCESNESPLACAKREVLEEIGLDIEIKELLCIDYSVTTEGDNLKFVFYGGVINNDQIAQIRLQDKELIEYKFVPIEKALELIGPKKIRRIPHSLKALENETVAYLENGKKI